MAMILTSTSPVTFGSRGGEERSLRLTVAAASRVASHLAATRLTVCSLTRQRRAASARDGTREPSD